MGRIYYKLFISEIINYIFNERNKLYKNTNIIIQALLNYRPRIHLLQHYHHSHDKLLNRSFYLSSIHHHKSFHQSMNIYLFQIYYLPQTILHRNQSWQRYIAQIHVFFRFSIHRYKHLLFTFLRFLCLIFYL